MPRFERSKYRPERDSSAGFKQEAAKDEKVILAVPNEKSCPCGCGERPKGKKATFAMGHDARLRGILIRAHLTDTPVVYDYAKPGSRTAHEAMDLAAVHGWERYLEEAVERREDSNREVLAKAVGHQRLVRVGRWEYTGQVVAFYRNGEDRYKVEYVTKLGAKKTTIVPISSTREVEQDGS